MDLLPLSVLSNMPAGDAADQLAYLAHAARGNLATAIAKDEFENNGTQKDTLQGIYTEALASFARDLAGQILVRPGTNSRSAFLAFEGKLNNLISAMRVKELTKSAAGSSHIARETMSRATKRSLREDIAILISSIEESDLAAGKKKALLKRAKELQTELERDGVNIAKILTTAAAIASILGGGTTTALNAPKVVASIQRIHLTIGDEVLDQEEQALALPAPQKLLAAPESEG